MEAAAVLVMLTIVAIPFLAAVWVYFNARKRYESAGTAFLWALGVFLMLIIFLPLYFIVRPRPLEEQRAVVYCKSCGQYNPMGSEYCKHCGTQLTQE